MIEAMLREAVPPRGRKLVDGDALRHALTALARTHRRDMSRLRAEALALLKAVRAAAWARARDGLVDGQYRGGTCAEILSAAQDAMLQSLCDFTRIHILRLANPTEAEQVTVLAVGGYGRGRLAPSSDIDLLFLLPYKRNAACESFVEYVLYMLWDMGLKVGHATRPIKECLAQAEADMTVRTAMLDARFLWGARAHFDALEAEFAKFIARGSARDFVAAKLDERDRRHERTGRSRYLVEPELKDGKGGLRDLDTLFWIARYCYGADATAEWARRGVFSKEELARFKRCENFLWTVRCHLHFLAGRAEERLSFDVQPQLTRLMGGMAHDAPLEQARIERFMRQYFLTAKQVGDLTAIFCAALEEEQKKSVRKIPNPFRRAREIEGFHLAAGRLRPTRRDLFERKPTALIRLFHLADKFNLDIHPDTVRQMTRLTHLVDKKLRADAEANQLFLEILTSKRAPERTLRRMNETGILGKFIPDFGRIVAMMQFNMYHHYTADEHLLRAIGIAAELEHDPPVAELPIAARLFTRGALNRRVFYLTVLLHDIAKGRREDHSIAGARIARRLGPRLGFTPEETALTAWLVEEHLLMSDVAQRRDLTDPQTVEDFVARVQTMERLNLLYVLTIVDISAVGPGVWTAWKAQLLEELYLAAETRILGAGAPIAHKAKLSNAQAALRARLPDWSDAAFKKYRARHADGYWLVFDSATLTHHAHLLTAPTAAPHKTPLIDVTRDATRGVDVLTFIGRDQSGLFARLTAACAMMELDILDARITTMRDGLVLDHLDLSDKDPRMGTARPLEGQRRDRLRETIAAVLADEALPMARLARGDKKPKRKIDAFSVTPAVRIDNDLAERATVIEIVALDRPFLLHAVARTLFAMNVSLISARVATFGARASDVFYVQDLRGQKIAAAKRKALERRLLEIIAAPRAVQVAV